MDHKKKMPGWMVIDTVLPSELLHGQFLLELLGRERVLIENHQGILEYGSEKICIKTAFGSVAVSGTDLHLSCLSKERLVIVGPVSQVAVTRRDC